MEAYRIVEWTQRYEVTGKGNPASKNTSMDQIRKSPLPYIRFVVHGHSHGPAYRKLMQRGFTEGVLMGMAAFGLFAKLLELAANQEREYRGWILDEKQRPMNAAQIADMLGVQHDAKYMEKLLKLLLSPDIGWVKLEEFHKSPENSRQIRESYVGALGKKQEACPKAPENSRQKREASEGSFKNENETETEGIIKINENKGVSDSTCEVSGSASIQFTEERVKAMRQSASLFLAEHLPVANQSDGTTICHILDQLERGVSVKKFNVQIFDEVVVLAKSREVQTAKNKMAMFVASVKQPPFGYLPERKMILRRRS